MTREPRYGLLQKTTDIMKGLIMLNVSTIENSNVVTADYSGSLGVDDEKNLRSVLQEAVNRSGRIRLLVTIGDIDLGRMEPKAVWMDLKTAGFFKDVDKLAVVTDASWLAHVSDWAGDLTDMSVGTYPSGQRNNAVAWITE